jgi:hypothetical protein
MRSTLLLLIVLAGCNGGDTCSLVPQWKATIGANLTLRGAPDGSVVGLDQGSLVRASPTGDVGTVVVVGSGFGRLALDDSGAPVVSWQTPPRVAGYDYAFHQRWSIPTFSWTYTSFDAGPNGEAAFAFDGADQTQSIVYVDATGSQRWRLDGLPGATQFDSTDGHVHAMRLATNGDVFGFGDHRRRRFAEATGAVTEDLAIGDPANFDGSFDWPRDILVERDGGWVAIADTEQTSVARYDVMSTVQESWNRSLMTTTSSPIVSTNGDVIAITAIGTQVIRLDGATGETRSEGCIPAPSLPELIYADSTGYLLQQGEGDIERYAQP